MIRPLYQVLASLAEARQNCAKSGNIEWFDRHSDRAEALIKEYLPSGSGFDAGTRIDWERSHADSLVFLTSFHHMDEHGSYDGWTEHSVRVKPSLAHGFDLVIAGKDRNAIKDHIHEAFNVALDIEIDPDNAVMNHD